MWPETPGLTRKAPDLPPKAEDGPTQIYLLTLCEREVAIVKAIVQEGQLTITDLIGGEYSSLVQGLTDSQKLLLLTKLERLGIL